MIHTSRISKLSIVELSSKNSGLLSTSITRGRWCLFHPRKIFYPAMRGQMLKFRKNMYFSKLQACIKKPINCGDMKLSPLSLFFYEKHDELLRCHEQIFVTYDIMEGNDVILTEKNRLRASLVNGFDWSRKCSGGTPNRSV